VVVEKPFTPTHKEAEELVALAKQQGKLLAVYQSAFLSPRLGTIRMGMINRTGCVQIDVGIPTTSRLPN